MFLFMMINITRFIDSSWIKKMVIYVNDQVAFWARLSRHGTGLSPPVGCAYWPFQGGASFVDHLCYFCLVFVILSCTSVYRLVVTCWKRADLLALVCDISLWSFHFPIGFLGQVWCMIVWIPDPCPLSYFNMNNYNINIIYVINSNISFNFYINQ